MTFPKPSIVIVGGGFAGFWAAAAARRAGGSGVDITLVSSGGELQMRPRLYEAHPETLGVELAPFLHTLDVRFIIDTAVGLDLDRHEIILRDGVLAFDRAVIAAGSVMRRPNVAGADEAFSIDTQAEAIAFDRHLARLADSGKQITVVVVGAGFTGIELALELRTRLAALRTSEQPDDLRIVLVDRAADVGVDLGPNPRPFIAAALSTARVELRMQSVITAMTNRSLTFADGSTLDADAVVLATGLQASPFVANVPGLRDAAGRVVVDGSLRAPDAPHVFVAGDAAAADTGDSHTSLQSCQHALQLGRFAGENAARDALGQATINYEQRRYVTCLDLGRSGAVFTTGWDREVAMSGDEAKVIKRKINTEVIYPPIDASLETLLELSRLPQTNGP